MKTSPSKRRDFRGVELDQGARLKSRGIRSAGQMPDAGRSREQRNTLSGGLQSIQSSLREYITKNKIRAWQKNSSICARLDANPSLKDRT